MKKKQVLPKKGSAEHVKIEKIQNGFIVNFLDNSGLIDNKMFCRTINGVYKLLIHSFDAEVIDINKELEISKEDYTGETK